MTLEMGKPVLQSKAEVEKCAWVCRYYAENAERFLQDEPIATDASKSYAAFQPLGVILGIMPWNFPFWQVFRFAAPTLMAGNTIILKHASNVTRSALAIEKIFSDAGFPDSVFTAILVPGSQAGQVISNPAIKGISLTGSSAAGRAVAMEAGKHLKKCVLELGGSDPYIILADADLDAAIETCVASRLINGGQSCIAAKRFIVDKSIYKQFSEMFVEKFSSIRMGDPMDAANHLGPLARRDLRDELHSQTVRSLSQGAVLAIGGVVPDGAHSFYPPTILLNVTASMPAFCEELFGPVAPILVAENEQQAISLANNSVYGLGAAVFTKDITRGEHIAKHKLRAGSCFVNAFVKSDPRLPFGGINDSGYGRELSHYGIKEFTNLKSIYIK
jgi:succinate-semialdehyde dehydrogenase/glutarate-semialdehyde dehydrogenase